MPMVEERVKDAWLHKIVDFNTSFANKISTYQNEESDQMSVQHWGSMEQENRHDCSKRNVMHVSINVDKTIS